MTNEERLAAVEERGKSNSHRLDELERRQDDLEKLTSSVEVLAYQQKTVESDVKEIKADVKALSGRPAKRWESLVDKLLLALAGAFVAWLCSGAPGL